MNNQIIKLEWDETPLIKLAYDIACETHKGEVRRNGGELYINHCIRVANKLIEYVNENYCVVALLHDVIEAHDLTIENLLAKGISEYHAYAVGLLSRQKDQNYFDYIISIKYSGFVRTIKTADLEDNMSDLMEGSLKDKYRFAHYILTQENI